MTTFAPIRHCSGCEQEQPIENFRAHIDRDGNIRRYESKCCPCEKKERSQRWQRSRLQRDSRAKVDAAKVAQVKRTSTHTHTCVEAECTVAVKIKGSRCNPHLEASRAARREADILRSRLDAESLKAKNEDTFLSGSTSKCRKCGGRVMTMGYMHYSCSTGRPRTIFNEIERLAALST